MSCCVVLTRLLLSRVTTAPSTSLPPLTLSVSLWLANQRSVLRHGDHLTNHSSVFSPGRPAPVLLTAAAVVTCILGISLTVTQQKLRQVTALHLNIFQ